VQQATYRISEAALGAGNLHALLATCIAFVGELMPAHNFYVALYDDATPASASPTTSMRPIRSTTSGRARCAAA